MRKIIFVVLALLFATSASAAVYRLWHFDYQYGYRLLYSSHFTPRVERGDTYKILFLEKKSAPKYTLMFFTGVREVAGTIGTTTLETKVITVAGTTTTEIVRDHHESEYVYVRIPVKRADGRGDNFSAFVPAKQAKQARAEIAAVAKSLTYFR